MPSIVSLLMHVHYFCCPQSLHSPLLTSKATKKLAEAAKAVLHDPSTAPPYNLALVDIKVRDAAFVESADCFAALVAKPEARRKLLRALAVLWALPESHVDEIEALKKPTVSESHTEVLVGRAVLERADLGEASTSAPAAPASSGKKKKGGSGGKATSSGSTFARTGHAMRMMERVAVALAQKEPVLLVGETGTGKTTLVSRISEMVGRPLVAFNMSQQTDSSDLLGGFKPVDARDALLPLLNPFLALVRRTWTKGNNEEFLSRCVKFAEKKKWSHLLQAFKTAVGKVQGAAEAGEEAGADEQQPAKKRKVLFSEDVRWVQGYAGIGCTAELSKPWCRESTRIVCHRVHQYRITVLCLNG